MSLRLLAVQPAISIAVFCLALLGFAASCHLSDDEKGSVVKVSPAFTLEMLEQLGEVRQLQFQITSIELLQCLNYTVDYRVETRGKLVKLTLNDIVTPENCLAGEAPASATAHVGYLPNGIYDVQVNLKNTIFNAGKLTVGDDAFLLEMDSQDGFELARSELKRIQEGVVWGFAGYEQPAEVGGKPDDFLAELSAACQPPALANGFYTFFTVKSSNEVVLLPTPGFTYYKSFLHRCSGELQPLKDLLETCRSSPEGSKMTIQLLTWDGRSL